MLQYSYLISSAKPGIRKEDLLGGKVDVAQWFGYLELELVILSLEFLLRN